MEEYEITEYSAGDELKILELYSVVFGKSLSMGEWEWRFVNNPFGQKMISLMWDKDVLIGHYAVSPVEVMINGEPRLTALSLSTMTHPNYTGRGVFKKLATHLYEKCRASYGVEFVWGFPNNNSHYGFIKNLNWIDIGVMPNFKSNRLDYACEIDFNLIDKFNLEHELSNIEYSDSVSVRVNKTADYLNWRYCSNPSKKYKIVEFSSIPGKPRYVVYKTYMNESKKEVDVLELVCEAHEKMIVQLLAAVIKVEENNVKSINMWCSLSDKKHLILEKVGFQNEGHVTYFAALNDVLKFENTNNISNWNLSFGDSDVY